MIALFLSQEKDGLLQVLYILQLQQDSEAGTAHVSSVSEFLLTQPILSFALLDAGRRRLVKAQEYDAEHAWSCTTGVSIISFAAQRMYACIPDAKSSSLTRCMNPHQCQ